MNPNLYIIILGLLFTDIASGLECRSFLSSKDSLSQNYRLDEKENTFPDLHPKTEHFINYTNQVYNLRRKDQCAQGCSFNALASYLEAVLSFTELGDVRSDSSLEISANYMHAIFMYWQFRWALLDSDRKVMLGGTIEWSLGEFLNRGFYLENDFKSINTVDVEFIRQQLNQRLLQIRVADPDGSKTDLVQESAFALRIIKAGFGSSPLGNSFYNVRDEFKDKSVNSISFEQNAYLVESVSIGGDTHYAELTDQELQSMAVATIVRYIDLGLPLLLSYKHSSEFITRSTGVLSRDSSIEPEIGHAALIVGYRLDSKGRVDMLKIQNSHANAPFFHMTIEAFNQLAMAVVYLTPLE